MARYKVTAEYTVRKEMLVVTSGDPNDPAAWEDIEWEHDQDCYLRDVLRTEPAGEDD